MQWDRGRNLFPEKRLSFFRKLVSSSWAGRGAICSIAWLRPTWAQLCLGLPRLGTSLLAFLITVSRRASLPHLHVVIDSTNPGSLFALLPLVRNQRAARVVQPGAPSADAGGKEPVPVSRSCGAPSRCTSVPGDPRAPCPAVATRAGGDGTGVAHPPDSLPSLGELHFTSTFSLWHRCRLLLLGL